MAAESSSEPAHPSRLLKKKNMGVFYPRSPGPRGTRGHVRHPEDGRTTSTDQFENR